MMYVWEKIREDQGMTKLALIKLTNYQLQYYQSFKTQEKQQSKGTNWTDSKIQHAFLFLIFTSLQPSF